MKKWVAFFITFAFVSTSILRQVDATQNINIPGGATGATGAGSTGTSGRTGPSGATGASGAGFTGASGVTGASGTNGSAGSNGSTGLTGATGASGTNGSNGAIGSTGATGKTGLTGASGTNGTNGNTGLTGATGASGTNGSAGSTGATGASGTNGTVGLTGATGATGATPSLPGSNYLSVYYPSTSANNWTLNSATYADFTANGTIPTPTTSQNSNFTGVGKATSSLPGVAFTTPARTGIIRVTVIALVQGNGVDVFSLQLLETVTSTTLSFNSGSVAVAGGGYMPVVLSGYFSATSSTAYNFKVQAKSTGAIAIGNTSTSIDACLLLLFEYVT